MHVQPSVEVKWLSAPGDGIGPALLLTVKRGTSLATSIQYLVNAPEGFARLVLEHRCRPGPGLRALVLTDLSQAAQGGLAGLLLRLRQDGHSALRVVGPAGLHDVVGGLSYFVRWTHPALELTALTSAQQGCVYDDDCLEVRPLWSSCLLWQVPDWLATMAGAAGGTHGSVGEQPRQAVASGAGSGRVAAEGPSAVAAETMRPRKRVRMDRPSAAAKPVKGGAGGAKRAKGFGGNATDPKDGPEEEEGRAHKADPLTALRQSILRTSSAAAAAATALTARPDTASAPGTAAAAGGSTCSSSTSQSGGWGSGSCTTSSSSDEEANGGGGGRGAGSGQAAPLGVAEKAVKGKGAVPALGVEARKGRGGAAIGAHVNGGGEGGSSSESTDQDGPGTSDTSSSSTSSGGDGDSSSTSSGTSSSSSEEDDAGELLPTAKRRRHGAAQHAARRPAAATATAVATAKAAGALAGGGKAGAAAPKQATQADVFAELDRLFAASARGAVGGRGMAGSLLGGGRHAVGGRGRGRGRLGPDAKALGRKVGRNRKTDDADAGGVSALPAVSGPGVNAALRSQVLDHLKIISELQPPQQVEPVKTPQQRKQQEKELGRRGNAMGINGGRTAPKRSTPATPLQGAAHAAPTAAIAGGVRTSMAHRPAVQPPLGYLLYVKPTRQALLVVSAADGDAADALAAHPVVQLLAAAPKGLLLATAHLSRPEATRRPSYRAFVRRVPGPHVWTCRSGEGAGGKVGTAGSGEGAGAGDAIQGGESAPQAWGGSKHAACKDGEDGGGGSQRASALAAAVGDGSGPALPGEKADGQAGGAVVTGRALGIGTPVKPQPAPLQDSLAGLGHLGSCRVTMRLNVVAPAIFPLPYALRNRRLVGGKPSGDGGGNRSEDALAEAEAAGAPGSTTSVTTAAVPPHPTGNATTAGGGGGSEALCHGVVGPAAVRDSVRVQPPPSAVPAAAADVRPGAPGRLPRNLTAGLMATLTSTVLAPTAFNGHAKTNADASGTESDTTSGDDNLDVARPQPDDSSEEDKARQPAKRPSVQRGGGDDEATAPRAPLPVAVSWRSSMGLVGRGGGDPDPGGATGMAVAASAPVVHAGGEGRPVLPAAEELQRTLLQERRAGGLAHMLLALRRAHPHLTRAAEADRLLKPPQAPRKQTQNPQNKPEAPPQQGPIPPPGAGTQPPQPLLGPLSRQPWLPAQQAAIAPPAAATPPWGGQGSYPYQQPQPPAYSHAPPSQAWPQPAHGPSNGVPLASGVQPFQAYQPSTQTWSARPPPPTPSTYLAAGDAAAAELAAAAAAYGTAEQVGAVMRPTYVYPRDPDPWATRGNNPEVPNGGAAWHLPAAPYPRPQHHQQQQPPYPWPNPHEPQHHQQGPGHGGWQPGWQHHAAQQPASDGYRYPPWGTTAGPHAGPGVPTDVRGALAAGAPVTMEVGSPPARLHGNTALPQASPLARGSQTGTVAVAAAVAPAACVGTLTGIRPGGGGGDAVPSHLATDVAGVAGGNRQVAARLRAIFMDRQGGLGAAQGAAGTSGVADAAAADAAASVSTAPGLAEVQGQPAVAGEVLEEDGSQLARGSAKEPAGSQQPGRQEQEGPTCGALTVGDLLAENRAAAERLRRKLLGLSGATPCAGGGATTATALGSTAEGAEGAEGAAAETAAEAGAATGPTGSAADFSDGAAAAVTHTATGAQAGEVPVAARDLPGAAGPGPGAAVRASAVPPAQVEGIDSTAAGGAAGGARGAPLGAAEEAAQAGSTLAVGARVTGEEEVEVEAVLAVKTTEGGALAAAEETLAAAGDRTAAPTGAAASELKGGNHAVAQRLRAKLHGAGGASAAVQHHRTSAEAAGVADLLPEAAAAYVAAYSKQLAVSSSDVAGIVAGVAAAVGSSAGPAGMPTAAAAAPVDDMPPPPCLMPPPPCLMPPPPCLMPPTRSSALPPVAAASTCSVSVLFLGTGSAEPSKYRGASAVLVRGVGPARGSLLIDAGEGAFGAMVRWLGRKGALAQVAALSLVWLSHKHPDHVLGLPALLEARPAGCPPLLVVGPQEVAQWLAKLGPLNPSWSYTFLHCGDFSGVSAPAEEGAPGPAPAPYAAPPVQAFPQLPTGQACPCCPPYGTGGALSYGTLPYHPWGGPSQQPDSGLPSHDAGYRNGPQPPRPSTSLNHTGRGGGSGGGGAGGRAAARPPPTAAARLRWHAQQRQGQGLTPPPPSSQFQPPPRQQASAAAAAAAASVCRSLGLVRWQSVAVHHCRDAWGLVVEHVDGWKLVYSGDTRPCPALIAAGRGATLLIHEATFEPCLEHQARSKRHSTSAEAAAVAEAMGAYRTVLTHFSQRYPRVPSGLEPWALPLRRRPLPAFDGMLVPLAALPALPHMLPPLALALAEAPAAPADGGLPGGAAAAGAPAVEELEGEEEEEEGGDTVAADAAL